MDINKLLLKLDQYKRFQTLIPCKSKEFYISVVVGEYQYCSPRETMDKANYTEFEIAIFTKDGEWATDEQKAVLNPILGEPRDMVYGWVTQEQIWACVDAL